MLILAGFNFSCCPQTIWKKTNTTTYMIEKGRRVYNSKTNPKELKGYRSDGYQVNDGPKIREIFKKVLSPDRRKELKDKRMPLLIYCKDSGEVVAVTFLFSSTPFLNVEEIQKIESQLLQSSFSLTKFDSEDKDPVCFAITVPFDMIQD